MKYPRHGLSQRLGFAFVLLVLSLAHAQNQPAATKPDTEEDKAVTLSPFVVSTSEDTGYIAADTLNAGRLRTNLLKTPGTMEVFTRDLLNDLGVFNIDEASAWLTSSHPLEAGGINGNSMNPGSLALHDSGSNVSLRGMATQPSTRNYFLSSTTPMEYNVQRIEAGRGPNAILYGEGGPGGGVNYITKKAEHRTFGTVRVRADTEGSRGFSFDLNRPLSQNFDLRYNASVLHQGHFVDRVKTKTLGNALSLVYRPFERTQVSVDADVSRSERPGFIMTSPTDQNSSWNQIPVRTTLTTAQATAAGLALRANSIYRVYVEGMGVVDMRGTAFTSGSGIPLVSSYPAGLAITPPPDRSFNVNPSDINVKGKTVDLQAAIDQAFRSGLSFQLAGQYAKYSAEGGNYAFTGAYIDPNVTLPGGIANPNFGKLFSASYYGRKIDGTFRDAKTARFVAAYPVKAFGGTTTVSAFAHHQETNSRAVYWDMQIADPRSTLSITSADNRINVYRYWDNLAPRFPDFSKLYDMRAVPTADGLTKNKNDAIEVAASGSYLHDRLTYVAGFRRDKSALVTSNGETATRNRVTGAFVDYTVDDRVAYNNVTTLGAVYFPLERVGVYADHSEGFTIQSNSNPKMDGTFAHANIVPSKAESIGLRLRLARTDFMTIVGSAGYYQAEQSNSSLGINVGAINTIWQNHRMPERYLETFSSSPTVTTALNSIQTTRSFSGQGWEGNLTMNLGNSFRLIGNVAFPRTRQFDTAVDYRAYVDANTAQWQQWANDPTNATRVSDGNMLRTIQNTVNGFQDDREQNGTYKYRTNVTGVYTVRQGALRGLRVGGGSQFYGPRMIGNLIDRPYDYIYAKTYYLVSGSLGYPIKLQRNRLDLQLNVENLLNYDDPMYNGMIIVGDRLIPYGFRRLNPRVVRLTSTLSF